MDMKVLLAFFLTLTLTSCEKLAVEFTPKKQAILSNSKLANDAEQTFWQTLHTGDYKNIENSDRLLMAAYLENPNDPRLAAHLGFLHIWKIAEYQREPSAPPTIVDEIILAKKYFADANELDPNDARTLGFLGDSELISGQIFHDQREQTRGYYTLQHAIKAWPEFNYFTAGYLMTTLPAKSRYFNEAMEWQWKTLNLCSGEFVNRGNPDFAPYMKRQTTEGPQRACWNSWIAPYNFEGFFLNMGDMLVKSGDWQTGIILYKNAQLDKDYASWPYRDLLETRIRDAKDNVEAFRQESIPPHKTVLFNSGYGCVVCHQKAKTKLAPLEREKEI